MNLTKTVKFSTYPVAAFDGFSWAGRASCTMRVITHAQVDSDAVLRGVCVKFRIPTARRSKGVADYDPLSGSNKSDGSLEAISCAR